MLLEFCKEGIWREKWRLFFRCEWEAPPDAIAWLPYDHLSRGLCLHQRAAFGADQRGLCLSCMRMIDGRIIDRASPSFVHDRATCSVHERCHEEQRVWPRSKRKVQIVRPCTFSSGLESERSPSSNLQKRDAIERERKMNELYTGWRVQFSHGGLKGAKG
jgi:hypothetical protein